MQKNWNSMKPVSEQSGADARLATIHLLHDAGHRSVLILPVGDPTAACSASNPYPMTSAWPIDTE
jgi:predicted HD phosphohydrolase